MIVRNGRSTIDHGPTPGRRQSAGIAGSIVVAPAASVRKDRPRPDPDYVRDWKRRKRETDPEWVERVRAQDREYSRRRYAAIAAEKDAA